MKKKTYIFFYLKLFVYFFFSHKKYMCMSRRYGSDTHTVTTTAIRSEQMCNYDLDDMDLRWLSAMNGERALMGATTISGTWNWNIIEKH